MEVHRHQALSLGVLGRIQFHGFEPHPELAFRASDVFVYPNQYDPFGMVGTEAMASGIPVVMGKNIGVSELVIPGKNGLLCDPTDPTDIRNQLTRLAAISDRGRALGLAGRATISLHTWDTCAKETLGVYEAVWRQKFDSGNT